MSEQAKQNIEQAFHRALARECHPGARRRLRHCAGNRSELGGQPGETLLVISISTFVFRLLTLFQLAAIRPGVLT